MPYRLTGEAGGRSISYTLKEGRNLLGSAAESDIRIEDVTISRRHAEIVPVSGGAEVTDLGSRNGTTIAGRKITRGVAASGDRIAFGQVSLVLEWVTRADAEPAFSFDAPAGTGTAIPSGGIVPEPTTVGTRAADTFAFEHFPSLLQVLAEGAGGAMRAAGAKGDDESRMAQAAGAALFRDLPVTEVAVTALAGGQRGVLYEARREGAGPAGDAVVEIGDAASSIRVVFLSASAARLFRPLVEGAATLIRLAAGRGSREPEAGERRAAPPPPTEPASVVAEVQRLYREAAQVAKGEVGVLITGESGTGKEILARYIHAASPRSRGAFVAINCAALPRDLLESELFGIEKGVATGVDARAGKFEQAHGGTLFLDEIGDMALDTQARILRVLQEGEVYRLGGSAARKAHVRILAATNQEIRRLIAEGKFREDLFYRIATWSAALPPLRQRRPDIANLAAHFLSREAARRGVRVKGISRGALDLLVEFPWPGNIRQLEKEMSLAVLFLADGELLDTTRLSPEIRSRVPAAGGPPLEAALEGFERAEISRALRDSGGDVAAAAAALGLGRSTLYRRMKALGIDAPPA